MKTNYGRLAAVERYAAEVLEGLSIRKLPIDPCAIAREEGIELAEGDYGADFFGRIEYHPTEGGFILFHPTIATSRYPAAVRFSVGHELAHYYLPEHADLLRAGRFHDSQPDFVCDDALEREADHFSGALLMPERVLKDRCGRRGFLDFAGILKLAADCATSATSSAIRYTKFAEEACVAVLSNRAGEVLCSVPSQEAEVRGWRWVANIPGSSMTFKATAPGAPLEISGAATTSDLWFPNSRNSAQLWEEAFPLGYTDRVLTLLAPSS